MPSKYHFALQMTIFRILVGRSHLALRRRIENTSEIAGVAPWFATYEKTKGELDFYVRSLSDYKNYGIEVKSTDQEARTARKLLEDKKLDYLYLLKGRTKGGIKDRIYIVPLCLADRITFHIAEPQ